MGDEMKTKVFNILKSILIMLAIFITFSMVKNLKHLNYSNFYYINVISMGIIGLLLNHLFNNTEIKLTKFKKFLCYLFAIFMIIGEAYISYKSITIVWKNVACIILSVIKLFGYASLFKLAYQYLDNILSKRKNSDLKPKHKFTKWYMDKFEKYPFITSLISILLIFGIYMYAFYPIVLSPDPSFQIKMFFNEHTKYIDGVIQRDPTVFMTNHHPVLQTFLIGNSIKLGQKLLSDNFGLFIYTFGQSIVYASCLAYSIKFAKKNGVKSKWRLVLLLTYMFVPMFAIYTVSGVKDTLYTAFMLMLVLSIFDIVKNYHNKKIPVGYLIHMFAMATLMCLFRHNGLYIAIIVTPFVVLCSKPNRFRLFVTYMMFIASVLAFNKVLVPALGISDGSPREKYSIPFQQTARYVKYYADELTDEDIKAIDKVLGYETLAERYKPQLSDPVKNQYNKYATSEDMKAYFKVWFKGLKKHPLCYIEATLYNTFGYVYPNTHKWYVYTEYDDRVTQNDLLDYSFKENRSWLRNILKGYANIFPYIPIYGTICSTGINIWIILIMVSYIIKKHKKYLIVLLPLFMSWVVCMVSPANTYFRYVMPIIYLIPVLTLLLMSNIRGDKNE